MRAPSGIRRKRMASTGKSGLRRWEFPTGSGIRIQEIINRNAGSDHSLSYRVTIPARLSGVRQFRQFPTVEAAEEWASFQSRGIAEHGRRHFVLTPQQRDDAIDALTLLDGTSLTLVEAAKLARNAYHPPAGGITVADAIGKLLGEKDAENLRDRSVRDLKNRLDLFGETFGRRLLGEVSRAQIEQWPRGSRTGARSASTRSAIVLVPTTTRSIPMPPRRRQCSVIARTTKSCSTAIGPLRGRRPLLQATHEVGVFGCLGQMAHVRLGYGLQRIAAGNRRGFWCSLHAPPVRPLPAERKS